MTFDAQNHERVDRWLANLAREANHAVIVQDLLGRIVSWNEGASKMYGYTNEESFEMPINALIPNAMREGHRDRIEQTLRHGYTEPFETTRRTRTGEILDVFVEITLLRDKSGQPESVATVERDISQQRLHEGQIQKMEERATELNEAAEVLLYELNEASTEVERKEGLINGILEGAADGIITFDPAGRIDTCNNSANRIFGYSAGETIGMEVGALIPAEGLGSPLGALQGPIDGLLAESGPAMDALEATGWRSSGESFPLTYSVSELKDSGVHVYTIILRDESQRKLAEDQLNQALQRAEAGAEAKGQFMATMSHEIRTPMNAIIALGELLGETDLDEEQHDLVKTIGSSSLSLLSIINDILDFSKSESGSLEVESVEVDLRELVEDVGQMMAPQAVAKGNELIIKLDWEKEFKITSDPTRLRQVLINLTSNAIKFTDGGEVEISAAVEQFSDGTDRLILAVRDTGVGIPPEAHARVFESFSQADSSTTRQFGGTGLGLAICKNLAQAFGGEIGLESKMGEGSRFWFEIPTKAELITSSDRDLSLKGKSVLLVEGHAGQRARTETIFQSLGAEVHGYASAELAVAALDGPPHGGCDLAIFEYKVEGSRWSEVVATLRARPGWERTPLLILNDPGQDFQSTGLSELDHCVASTKPLRVAAVGIALRALFTKAAGEPTLAADAKVEAPSTPKKKTAATQFGLHVLLVEDNPINRKVAGKLLQRIGCTWDVAENGERAVQAALSGDHYDLILMDLMMPVMGGIDAAKEIRKREDPENPHTIIAMTANAMQGDREVCMEAGMNDYLAKPVRIVKLDEMFNRWSPSREDN